MTLQEFIQQLNRWASERVPFLFVIDFELEKPFACKLELAFNEKILYAIRGRTNFADNFAIAKNVRLEKIPLTLSEYRRKYDLVASGLAYGDSFLTNLTVKTEIESAATLEELFFAARAKYKLLFKNQFVVFSPESFIRIDGEGVICAFPMKGTIDASIPHARELILANPKELAEHVTIVDLMRNDLSRVASEVRVERFRYIDELKTSEKNLLQVSSEIAGRLPENYRMSIGTLLVDLLPAGSVSGAPKPRTLKIIREAEGESRGYYAGVFGYLTGKQWIVRS